MLFITFFKILIIKKCMFDVCLIEPPALFAVFVDHYRFGDMSAHNTWKTMQLIWGYFCHFYGGFCRFAAALVACRRRQPVARIPTFNIHTYTYIDSSGVRESI